MAYRKGFRRGSGPGPGGQGARGQATQNPGTSGSSGQNPGTSGSSGGDRHPPAQPVAHTVAPTAQYDDRIQRMAAQNQRTRNLRNQAAGQGFHQFLTPRDQTAKKTLGMRMSGLGGLFGALGRGALSFFGGIPGKALSGILTAKNWAKQKGSGVLQGIGEFGDTDEEGNPLYPTWDRYINRNTGKYDDKPYLGQGQSNYTFDDQVVTDVVNPNLNNLGVDNQFIEEEQNFDPNFLALGAAEGGRIGYERGRVVNPGGYNGVIDRNIANLKAALEYSDLTPEERAQLEADLQMSIEAKGGWEDQLLSGDPVSKAQGGLIGYFDGGIAGLL